FDAILEALTNQKVHLDADNLLPCHYLQSDIRKSSRDLNHNSFVGQIDPKKGTRTIVARNKLSSKVHQLADALVRGEVIHRIGNASTAVANLRHLWHRLDVSLSVKGRVYTAVVRSIMDQKRGPYAQRTNGRCQCVLSSSDRENLKHNHIFSNRICPRQECMKCLSNHILCTSKSSVVVGYRTRMHKFNASTQNLRGSPVNLHSSKKSTMRMIHTRRQPVSLLVCVHLQRDPYKWKPSTGALYGYRIRIENHHSCASDINSGDFRPTVVSGSRNSYIMRATLLTL
ncbi:polyprotein, partial [Clonorchis sinensis]